MGEKNSWREYGPDEKDDINGSTKIKDMDEVVRLTLKRYKVVGKWRIVKLTDSQWKKLMAERAGLDQAALLSFKEISEITQQEINQLTLEEAREFKETSERLKHSVRELGKEYGAPFFGLEDYLEAVAAWLPITTAKEATKKRTPCIYRLANLNADKDFLIVISEGVFSSCQYRELLVSAAHEALHYVESVTGKSSRYDDIEEEADEIVRQFLKDKS